jgi:four helix bundle protein
MSGLEEFRAYRKAQALFDLVVEDMRPVTNESMCWKLVLQQIGSADSIASNIEEGYGRVSRAEYNRRILDFARGSARETHGRSGRMKHWLSKEIIKDRHAKLDKIIVILTATISTLSECR